MDPETIDGLHGVSVATLTLQLLKKGVPSTFMSGVRPLNTPPLKLVGPAYTLRYVPRREDLINPGSLGDPNYAPRRAIEEVPAGSVLVIDGRGVADIAVIGDILAERLKQRGVAGVVTDGGVRDVEEARRVGLPLYGAGAAAPASIAGHSAGDLQCPIGCGGVAVIPGDFIVADEDGAVVVPRELAGKLAREGTEQELYESWAKKQVEKGRDLREAYPATEASLVEFEAWREKQE